MRPKATGLAWQHWWDYDGTANPSMVDCPPLARSLVEPASWSASASWYAASIQAKQCSHLFYPLSILTLLLFGSRQQWSGRKAVVRRKDPPLSDFHRPHRLWQRPDTNTWFHDPQTRCFTKPTHSSFLATSQNLLGAYSQKPLVLNAWLWEAVCGFTTNFFQTTSLWEHVGVQRCSMLGPSHLAAAALALAWRVRRVEVSGNAKRSKNKWHLNRWPPP